MHAKYIIINPLVHVMQAWGYAIGSGVAILYVYPQKKIQSVQLMNIVSTKTKDLSLNSSADTRTEMSRESSQPSKSILSLS